MVLIVLCLQCLQRLRCSFLIVVLFQGCKGVLGRIRCGRDYLVLYRSGGSVVWWEFLYWKVGEWFVSEVLSGFLFLIVSSGGALVFVDVGGVDCM